MRTLYKERVRSDIIYCKFASDLRNTDKYLYMKWINLVYWYLFNKREYNNPKNNNKDLNTYLEKFGFEKKSLIKLNPYEKRIENFYNVINKDSYNRKDQSKIEGLVRGIIAHCLQDERHNLQCQNKINLLDYLVFQSIVESEISKLDILSKRIIIQKIYHGDCSVLTKKLCTVYSNILKSKEIFNISLNTLCWNDFNTVNSIFLLDAYPQCAEDNALNCLIHELYDDNDFLNMDPSEPININWFVANKQGFQDYCEICKCVFRKKLKKLIKKTYKVRAQDNG